MVLSKKISDHRDFLRNTGQGTVLIDIFSFSCMNCRRSLEYISKLSSRYGRYGLKTIMVHTPEWRFEKNQKNILHYLRKKKLDAINVFDSRKNIIKKYKVNFWPSQILLHHGKVVYRHIGEGDYKRLEHVMRKLLKVKSARVFTAEPKYSRYGCFYLGKKKQNKKVVKDGIWHIAEEYLKGEGSITLSARCKSISIVAEAPKRSFIYLKSTGSSMPVIITKPDLYRVHTFNTDSYRKLALIIKNPIKIYSIVLE